MPSVTASKLDDVTQLILTTLGALPEFSGVVIFDGPPVGKDNPKRVATVGDDGDPDNDVDSSFTQEWSNLNHTRKRETGEIPCSVIVWSGDTVMKDQRDAAFALFAAAETAILALASDDLTVEITAGRSRPVQNEYGAAMWIPFSVQYSTTL